MKKSTFVGFVAVTFIVASAFAAENETPVGAGAVASSRENAKSFEDLAKPNANHKLLAELVGTWNYTLKIWLGATAVETSGVVVRQPIMDGRYFMADFSVEMLPGADGKLQKARFKGKSIEGYDNVKQKFVSIWIDNGSTAITTFEGSYDPELRTFSYDSTTEAEPGKITKVREVIKVADRNHYSLEWFEDHGGHDVKTVEINYTRKT